MIVNGKEYPLWSQFVERKNEWVGGTLHDLGGMLDHPCSKTEIIDVTLVPNGEDSAFFGFKGKGYDCGFDVKYGGVAGVDDPPWLHFSGSYGLSFRVKKK